MAEEAEMTREAGKVLAEEKVGKFRVEWAAAVRAVEMVRVVERAAKIQTAEWVDLALARVAEADPSISAPKGCKRYPKL